MKTNKLEAEEKAARTTILAKWDAAEAQGTSRSDFLVENVISSEYLKTCCKWRRSLEAYEEIKEKHILVPVVTSLEKTASPLAKASNPVAIHIRLQNARIEVSGDIPPLLLERLVVALGAQHVL
jgi:hypothetical protein